MSDVPADDAARAEFDRIIKEARWPALARAGSRVAARSAERPRRPLHWRGRCCRPA
jgi:hypothetical protein